MQEENLQEEEQVGVEINIMSNLNSPKPSSNQINLLTKCRVCNQTIIRNVNMMYNECNPRREINNNRTNESYSNQINEIINNPKYKINNKG